MFITKLHSFYENALVKGWTLPLGSHAMPGYRTLIETVYSEAKSIPDGLDEISQKEYEDAFPKWGINDRRMEANAAERLVPKPACIDELFTPDKPILADEDDPQQSALPKHLVAATRNPDSINAEVLLLYQTRQGWSIEPNGETILRRPSHKYIDRETLKILFGAAVRISNRGIVNALRATQNSQWTSLQNDHRILKRFYLLEMTNASAVVGQYKLTLDSRLGLRYEKLGRPSP